MTVDDEVTVRSLLVLTYASLDKRSTLQSRKTESDIVTNVFQRFGIDNALVVSGIEDGPTRVVGNLKTAPVPTWNAITKASKVIGPNRQMFSAKTIVTGGRAKEKNILLCGLHQVADGSRKHFSEPRPASEHVTISLE